MPADTDRGRDRDHLLERLHNLRTVVPVFAQELASARRHAAQLRRENDRLAARVQELQRERAVAANGGAGLVVSRRGTVSADIVRAPRAHGVESPARRDEGSHGLGAAGVEMRCERDEGLGRRQGVAEGVVGVV